MNKIKEQDGILCITSIVIFKEEVNNVAFKQ